ncbi:MAG: polysaccharide pyruvyl transferase family protein [Candidatus Phocaeicola faecipullorum]|nr:polysaccharide pyruvyl transferase family protein [Candidatus Phocaeicola faecipullorum]
MKPIGLVTCYFHHNYGSMLQAYATEMIMQRMGLPFQTIACKAPIDYMQENKLIYAVKKLLIGDWKMRLGKMKIEHEKKKNHLFAKNWETRNQAFNKFADESFHLSPFCKTRAELTAMAANYSAFLVGSDQLWRTDSVEHGYYTLEWVPDGIRKIAYSTSIGVKEVPWFQVKKNRRFMNRFDFMALREQSACDLVHKLTGRDVQVVLDPTLLFTGNDWMKIQRSEPLTEGKYIFCYLLGNNPWQRDFIWKVKQQTGLKIVALQHLDEYIPSDEGFADEAPYNVGPCEFLNYIRNAEFVFTDSFHCSVFSILYKKQFFTFSRFNENERQSTNTRIDNLLNITGLQQRRMTADSNVEGVLGMSCDFSRVGERLDAMRRSSFNYLETALGGLPR